MREFIQEFIRYRKIFKNSWKVLLEIHINRFPLYARLRTSNKVIRIESKSMVYWVSVGVLDLNPGEITIRYRGGNLDFKCPQVEDASWMSTALVEQFVQEVYSFLNVNGKVVLDVGANIGDSAIYCVLNGAQKVIAIEPYPRLFELAKENIRLNACADKVFLLNAGVSEADGQIMVDPLAGNAQSDLVGGKSGLDIPLYPLDSIIEMFDLGSDAVLKVDCEGCEYGIVLSTRTETLRRFERIQIEYHHGLQRLAEKLTKSGFHVSFTEGAHHFDAGTTIPNRYLGYVYATRN